MVIRWVNSDVAASDGIRQLMAHNCELVSVTVENLKNIEQYTYCTGLIMK